MDSRPEVVNQKDSTQEVGKLMGWRLVAATQKETTLEGVMPTGWKQMAATPKAEKQMDWILAAKLRVTTLDLRLLGSTLVLTADQRAGLLKTFLRTSARLLRQIDSISTTAGHHRFPSCQHHLGLHVSAVPSPIRRPG